MTQTCVLVVAYDDDTRRRIGAWLDDAGYREVMFCPGPGGPTYTCIGGRGGLCPLPAAADVVVLDLRLRSDLAMRGTAAWQLMLYYYEHAKRIVVLSGADDPVRPWPEERIAVVRRPVDRDGFLAGMRAVDPATSRTPAADRY